MKPMIVGVAAAMFLSTGTSYAISIGLFSNSDCSENALCIIPAEADTMYIGVSTKGLPADEFFTSAEFRVTGLPAGWSADAIPAPGSLVIGDVFGAGATIGFGFSQVGECIPLFTVVITPSHLVLDVTLAVSNRVPPDPLMPCPRVAVICASRPCDVVYCAVGGSLSINSTRQCDLPVSSSTWSAVKSLYK